MNTNDEEISFLNKYLNDSAQQIYVLIAKYNSAETTAKKLTEEIHCLRERHVQAANQLRDIELHQSGMYMWENIGEGG